MGNRLKLISPRSEGWSRERKSPVAVRGREDNHRARRDTAFWLRVNEVISNSQICAKWSVSRFPLVFQGFRCLASGRCPPIWKQGDQWCKPIEQVSACLETGDALRLRRFRLAGRLIPKGAFAL
jgi:hypothetical protein